MTDALRYANRVLNIQGTGARASVYVGCALLAVHLAILVWVGVRTSQQLTLMWHADTCVGTITQCSVTGHMQKNSGRRVHLSYDYLYQGARLTGTQVTPMPHEFGDYAAPQVRDIIERFHPGASCTVYVPIARPTSTYVLPQLYDAPILIGILSQILGTLALQQLLVHGIPAASAGPALRRGIAIVGYNAASNLILVLIAALSHCRFYPWAFGIPLALNAAWILPTAIASVRLWRRDARGSAVRS